MNTHVLRQQPVHHPSRTRIECQRNRLGGAFGSHNARANFPVVGLRQARRHHRHRGLHERICAAVFLDDVDHGVVGLLASPGALIRDYENHARSNSRISAFSPPSIATWRRSTAFSASPASNWLPLTVTLPRATCTYTRRLGSISWIA